MTDHNQPARVGSTGGIEGRLGVGHQEVDAVMICVSADEACSLRDESMRASHYVERHRPKRLTGA
jgi:hypothetical protein